MARPKKKPTEPEDDRHKIPLTGFRIPREVLDALAEWTDHLNATAPEGYRTNRNALVVRLLREAAAKAGFPRSVTKTEGVTPPT